MKAFVVNWNGVKFLCQDEKHAGDLAAAILKTKQVYLASSENWMFNAFYSATKPSSIEISLDDVCPSKQAAESFLAELERKAAEDRKNREFAADPEPERRDPPKKKDEIHQEELNQKGRDVLAEISAIADRVLSE